MNRLLTAEDLVVVNRLLEWVSAARLAALEIGQDAYTHLDVDQYEGHWVCTVWLHYGDRAQEPKHFCGGAQPGFVEAFEATLAILPSPQSAALPEFERAPDTEPHHQKPSDPPCAIPLGELMS